MQMTRHDSIRAVTGTTRLFGCIASPTDHVRAPMIFNRIFAERNIDAVMVPVDIPAEQLSEGIKGLKKLGNFKGAAITIPHKLNLAALCDELGPGARAAAAVNAVRFADDDVCSVIILMVMVLLLVFWVKTPLICRLNTSCVINRF